MVHTVHQETLASVPEKAREALDAAIDELLAAIRQLRTKAKRVEEAKSKIGALRQTANEVAIRRDQIDAACAKSAKRCSDEEDEVERRIRDWASSLEQAPLAEQAID